ncbi:DNA-binding transcriptional repressor LldR [Serratia quinivorans]|nr:DNA-binding transcriptional repressor LldR [Serratia quinivorans]CAI1829206.1 DNA-binding transcriptional repressor LldR [Serratia quinivorans]
MIDTHFRPLISPIMASTLLTLFHLPEHANGTLRERVCSTLRRAIHSGTLSSGQRLPSSRVLAADLAVSRVTAEAAYGQLEAEGYLTSARRRDGWLLGFSALTPGEICAAVERLARISPV